MKFVITRQVVTIIGASVATAVLLGAGCEDPAARQRAETQRIIAEASLDLQIASLSAWDPGDASASEQRRRLDAITKKLPKDAQGGQQVAAALIASATNRELARISLSQAAAVEAENQGLFESLHSDVDAATRLLGLADGIEEVTTTELRAMLANERAKAESRLREHSKEMARLDGPIAEKESEIEQHAREATRLEDEAIALRRQAAEWGHAAGLSTFEQALSLEREADGYEYRIACSENDLEYDLRPEHALAGTHVAFLSDQLNAISETEKSLQARDDLGSREAAATRELIRTYRDKIAEGLETVHNRTDGDLQEYYTQAQRDLEQAVSQARTAANKSGRGEADAARLTLVRAYESQGQLFATRARGLGAHAALLERLIAGGDALGDIPTLRRELDTVRASETEALEQARAQLELARRELEQVKSRANQMEVDAFKRGLTASLTALGGEAGDDAPAGDTSGGGAPGREARRGSPESNATATATGGYATPEELVAMMNAVDSSDPRTAQRLMDVIHVTSPDARRMMDLQMKILGPQKELFAAMEEQFGAPPTAMLAGMGGPTMAATGDLKITNRTEDRATVDGGGPPMSLVKVDGSWKIDGDAMFGNPGMEQVADMMGSLAGVLGDLASRVRDGEFSGPEQVMQAMMAELGGAAAGMPGK